MDRGMVEDHLKQAEEHAALGERHIERQRELIARLEAHGHDTAQSRDLLRRFEELQVLHVEDRDRLRRMIREMDSADAASRE